MFFYLFTKLSKGKSGFLSNFPSKGGILMKYFVLHVISNESCFSEYYLKAKLAKHMEDTIKRYCNGIITTSRWTLMTSNVSHGFLREVTPAEYPHLTKSNFLLI